MFDFNYFFSNNVIVTVKIIGNPSSHLPQTVRLNLTDNLFIVRQKLEKDKFINDTLLFSRKYLEDNSNDGNISYGFAEISLEKEEDFRLNEIIDDKVNILYLNQSKINWKSLNELRKLDYGCTMTSDGIIKANKRAFEMKYCELTEIGAEGCRKGFVEFKSDNDRMMKTNLFFHAGINAQEFAKLGISIVNIRNEEINYKINSSYHFTKYGKASLKFSEYLEPTPEFIEVVNGAIESKDPEKFKQITKEFGQFIPMEVILGGRAHFDERAISIGKSAEESEKIAIGVTGGKGVTTGGKIEAGFNKLERKSNYCKSNCTKLIGGEPPSNLENFDDETWVESLKKYKNWDSIEFQNPISIFQLLPDDLRKQIILSVGKRIYHTATEHFNYRLEDFGRPKVFELDIPSDVLKIIQNNDADCNIFATVVNTTETKNDFFICQVLSPPPCPPHPLPRPSLIVHCIQKKFKKREYKLKIGWMVIGYYVDFNFILINFNAQLKILKNDFKTLNNPNMFETESLNFTYNSNSVPLCLGIPVLSKLDSSNDSLIIGHHFFKAQEDKIGACAFSYCLKNNHYVNLPNFTFHTLVISNYHLRNAYNIIPFKYSFMKKPYINLNNDITDSPKFISLYSTQKTNYGIFLKQKSGRIKIKSINCKNSACFICTNRTLITSEDNIQCALFDPSVIVKFTEIVAKN